MNTYASPLALALARFAARPAARFGLILLGLFILLAIYAPFLTSPVALFWWDEQGLSFPVLTHLFNKNHFDAPHHLLFNVLAVFLPVALLAWWWLGRRGAPAARRLSWGISALGLLLVLCLLPILPVQQGWQAPWSPRPPTTQTWLTYQAMESQPLAVFPPVVHGFRDKYSAYEPPFAMNERTDQRYWFGTDDRGADVLARMLYGARVSLTIGLVAVGISMAIGVLIGAASGYFGGWIDLILQRVVELMMTFPTFILVLVVISVLGRDIYIMMVVFGLTGWAGTARLVRGEYLREMGRDYVLAAQALGLPRWRIMFRHVLPNASTPLLISATFGIAGAVLMESGLAFIGLGDDSVPSWGSLLDVGRQQVQYAWLIWVPGLAIFGLVSALNLVGNALREALDPKEMQR